MPERTSVPEHLSKKWAREEIEEGLAETYSPHSMDGEDITVDLLESFDNDTVEKPLQRKEVENEATTFLEGKFKELLPALLSPTVNHGELIKRLDLTNEAIGLLGANYYIRKDDNGQTKIYQTDEYYPDGRELTDQEITASDLIALAYAKEAIRLDIKPRKSRKDKIAGLPQRYYLRSQKRYLCNNDFGMRKWNEEEKKMDNGEATNVAPFVQTVKKEIDGVRENLQVVGNDVFTRIFSEMEQAYLQETGAQYLDWQLPQELEARAWKRTSEELGRVFEQNPKDRELVLTAVPSRKVINHLHFNFGKIAEKYGFCTDNPVQDYDDFDKNSHKLRRLFKAPSEAECAGSSLNFVHSDFYKKPVIVRDNFDEEPLVAEARGGVHDVLALRAIESETEQVKEIFRQSRCGRGKGSPYFYCDYEVYDVIKKLGAERAGQVFDKDDRNISEQLKGLGYLQEMGYDIAQFEPTELRKQIHEAYKLDRAGVWRYMEKRGRQNGEQGHAMAKDKTWLEALGKRKARDTYREGKRMYWLAQKVFMHSPQRNQDDKFSRNDAYVNWGRYDLSKADVEEEKLNEHLEKNINLIAALLNQESPREEGKPDTGATLGLIVQALDHGQDLRGVALANDKQRYLEGIIGGKVQNDLEFAVQDWPAEWKHAVSKEEIELYYEYASDYVVLDPNGLAKYATWRASASGKEWAQVFKEAPKQKSDLDFRICIDCQNDEVRGWYKESAEYVGNETMQCFLLRFNGTRGAEGRMANWHDVLFWVPNIKKLEAGEAKSIILGIETMDDNQEFINFLPRYSKDRDPLRSQGSIQSLRELKKRIIALESNIDLSKFPPEVIDITSAPGFNLAALESMRRRADFADLVEGKLDKEQPFKPHTRIFAGRALTESLREGLGSIKQKIKGTATDVRGLFHSLNQLIKGRKLGERAMQVTDLFDAVPIDMEEEIIKLLREQRVDIGPTVEAQVHAKSDPEGWVCGNYTDCCMPFGASNNDDYMFNRSTQYFTIKCNGRIVAQSVVADSRDERDGSDVVIIDNIEVANNYKNLTPLLARVYQTFWTEYTGRPVKVGTGYSDLIPPGGKLEANHFHPKTSLSYSDAGGHQIYDMPKIRGVEALDEMVTMANLTERDAKLIAELELAVYPEGMAQGKSHIEEVLRKQKEMEVPGAASSFVMRQGSEAAGYLLMLPEESEVDGQRVAHVYDMAILPKYQGKGLAKKMMERVVEVATAYNVSIEAEARANTSYAILMNERTRKWLESKGFHLTKNDKMPEYLNGEDFYFVRFENQQNQNEQ